MRQAGWQMNTQIKNEHQNVEERESFFTVRANVNAWSQYGKQRGDASKNSEPELPDDPAIPLLGIYPDKSIVPKDTCITIFRAALFTTVKTRKTAYMSIHR